MTTEYQQFKNNRYNTEYVRLINSTVWFIDPDTGKIEQGVVTGNKYNVNDIHINVTYKTSDDTPGKSITLITNRLFESEKALRKKMKKKNKPPFTLEFIGPINSRDKSLKRTIKTQLRDNDLLKFVSKNVKTIEPLKSGDIIYGIITLSRNFTDVIFIVSCRGKKPDRKYIQNGRIIENVKIK